MSNIEAEFSDTHGFDSSSLEFAFCPDANMRFLSKPKKPAVLENPEFLEIMRRLVMDRNQCSATAISRYIKRSSDVVMDGGAEHVLY